MNPSGKGALFTSKCYSSALRDKVHNKYKIQKETMMTIIVIRCTGNVLFTVF